MSNFRIIDPLSRLRAFKFASQDAKKKQCKALTDLPKSNNVPFF